MANVEGGQAVITLDSEARDGWTTVAIHAAARPDAASIQQIIGVGTHLRPSVSSQELQAAGKLLFHFGLQAMRRAVSFFGGIPSVSPAISQRKATHRRMY